MNEFDEQLRRELDRRSGGAVPVAAGHDIVLARSGQIRRRRAAAVGGGALTAIVLAGLVFLTPGGEGSIVPADTTTPIARVTETTPEPDGGTTPGIESEQGVDASVSATMSSVPTTTVPATIEVVTPAPRAPVTESTTSPVVAVTQVPRPTSPPRTTAVVTTLPTAPTSSATPTSNTGAPSTTAAPSTSTSSSSTTPGGPAPFTRTYESAGGSIRVSWNGTALSLLSAAPAPDFVAEVEEQSADRIRVRFRGEPDDSRIEVRVDNGELRVDIS